MKHIEPAWSEAVEDVVRMLAGEPPPPITFLAVVL